MTWIENNPRQRRFILAVCLYLTILYGTLGITPYFFRWLLKTLGRDAYSISITLFLVGMGAVVLYRWRRDLLQLTPWRAMGFLGVVGGYLGVINMVTAAAKQLHTIQYGLLVWMFMEILRGRTTLPWVYGVAAAATMVAAALDETIQYWLPNRHGHIQDVLLDGLSLMLAQAAIFLVRERKALSVTTAPDPQL